MTVFGTDIYHYLYRRSATQEHAWRVTPRQLRDHESERGALDLGQEDLDIVTGERLVEADRLLSGGSAYNPNVGIMSTGTMG
jgi:hypothetical protein